MLVGTETADDAGVYRLRPDLAIVNTVDFFPPVVDDPYLFGQISATNSLSDVYAMGGDPKTCMNIVCFPKGKLDISILGEILKGGAEKVKEAGAVIIGGHSIIDDEIKYGMAVTGVIHPDKIFRNVGVQAGDVLILTKAARHRHRYHRPQARQSLHRKRPGSGGFDDHPQRRRLLRCTQT